MTNTFANGASFPVTISQIQSLARTLQKRMNFETEPVLPQQEVGFFELTNLAEPKVFTDRRGAGALLAAQLTSLAGRSDVVVIGIPQGGLLVASEVANRLQAPLVSWVVKKLHARLLFSTTLGAVAEDGELLIDEEAYQRLRVPPASLVDETRACRAEVKRRAALYKDASLPVELAGRTVVVVDDGIASGFSVRAALSGIRRRRPSRIVLAVPVAPREVIRRLQDEVDEIVTLETTPSLPDFAQQYVNFPPVTDEELVHLLHQHRSIPSRALPERRTGSFRQ